MEIGSMNYLIKKTTNFIKKLYVFSSFIEEHRIKSMIKSGRGWL